MNDKNSKLPYSVTYKFTDEGWVQLTPEMLAALYERKRMADKELRECAEYYFEQAVEASGMRQANEVIKYIMEKK
jgi:hypothetical protein